MREARNGGGFTRWRVSEWLWPAGRLGPGWDGGPKGKGLLWEVGWGRVSAGARPWHCGEGGPQGCCAAGLGGGGPEGLRPCFLAKGLLAGYLAPSSPPGQVLSSTFNQWDLEAHQGLWGRWSRSRSPGLRGPALRPLRLCLSRGLDGTGWARDHQPQRLWLEPWVSSFVGQVSPGTGWSRLADDPRSRAQGGDIVG